MKGKLIQNAYNLLNNTFWWKITLTLGPSISGTKCDRDKPIFSAEKGGQSDCVEVWNIDPIGLKISKTRVITAEPLYHAQVWEYPKRGLDVPITSIPTTPPKSPAEPPSKKAKKVRQLIADLVHLQQEAGFTTPNWYEEESVVWKGKIVP